MIKAASQGQEKTKASAPDLEEEVYKVMRKHFGRDEDARKVARAFLRVSHKLNRP